MTPGNMVIVGAGHAGCRAAEMLRSRGWQGGITLVNAESGHPYQRPPLSKAVLSGAASPRDAPLLGEDWLRENGIDYRPGTVAKRIRRDSSELELSDDTVIPYTRLLLATGARPVRPNIPGIAASGVHFLRTAADAESLARRMRPGARMVVVGGGLIGLEAAASAIERQCSVTVVEANQRLVARSVPPQIEPMIRDLHMAAGVDFQLCRKVTEIVGGESVAGVLLDDGSALAADIVLICIGILPDLSLAAAAGLAVGDGVLVDRFLCTSDQNIFAAGDVCSFEDRLFGPATRLECWKNAESQGALAARNMLCEGVPYEAVPWMWSDQYRCLLQIAGLPHRGVETVERRPASDSLLVFHLGADGRVVGVSGFGDAAHIGRAVKLGTLMIERGTVPDKAVLGDRSIDLRTVLGSDSKPEPRLRSEPTPSVA